MRVTDDTNDGVTIAKEIELDDLFGNLCFHFIEAVPRRIKTRFARYQKAAARHPPPRDKENKKCLI